ncbi:MAG: hypothetical protein ACRC4M_04090 [Mycoplasma sp.]
MSKHKLAVVTPKEKPKQLSTMSKEEITNYITFLKNKPLNNKNLYGLPIFRIHGYRALREDSSSSINRNFNFYSNPNGFLKYLKDAHGDLPFEQVYDIDPTLKDFIFIRRNENIARIFDLKKGFIDDLDILPKVHSDSVIYDLILSFDNEFLNDFAISSPSSIQGITSIVFNTIIENMKFNCNDWEIQGALHRNTKSWHFQFRMYQNDKTPINKILKKRFTISKFIIPLLRTKCALFYLEHASIYKKLYKSKTLIYKTSTALNDEMNRNFNFSNALLNLMFVRNLKTHNYFQGITDEHSLKNIKLFKLSCDKNFVIFFNPFLLNTLYNKEKNTFRKPTNKEIEIKFQELLIALKISFNTKDIISNLKEIFIDNIEELFEQKFDVSNDDFILKQKYVNRARYIHPVKYTPMEKEQLTIAACNSLIQYFKITSNDFTKKYQDFIKRTNESLSITLTETGSKDEITILDENGKPINKSNYFLETENKLKEISKEVNLILSFLLRVNFLKWVDELNGQMVKEWIAKNDFVKDKKFGILEIDEFIRDSIVRDNKIQEFENDLPLLPERVAKYHSPKNIKNDLSFNQISQWSKQNRLFYKQGISDLGNIFRKTFDFDFSYIQNFVENLSRNNSEIEQLKTFVSEEKSKIKTLSFKIS